MNKEKLQELLDKLNNSYIVSDGINCEYVLKEIIKALLEP
jgi:hypothetical protein